MDYSDNYYAATVNDTHEYAALNENIDADICIIGGGLAGLSCAFELAKFGKKIVLLESHKVGWGASGRNGGFVTKGYSQGLKEIETAVGLKKARTLFDMSIEGIEMVRDNIRQYDMQNVHMGDGVLSVNRYKNEQGKKDEVKRMADLYDYPIEFVSKDGLKDYCSTERYHQASYDGRSFHFHPLNYCRGLAEQITKLDGRIYEQTEALDIDQTGEIKTVKTQNGVVKAKQLVLCGGGYSTKAYGKVERSILPVATYVMVTEKLGDRMADYVRTEAGIIDDRMASDYYRVVDQDRFLWGGRITAQTSEPTELAELIKSDMVNVYPDTTDVKIEFAWTGLMAYARHKMPYVREINDNVYALSAFGGHGMNTCSIAGRVLAEEMAGQSDRIKLFDHYKLQWNGGIFGPLAAQTAYLGMRIGDYWRESR